MTTRVETITITTFEPWDVFVRNVKGGLNNQKHGIYILTDINEVTATMLHVSSNTISHVSVSWLKDNKAFVYRHNILKDRPTLETSSNA